MILQEENNNKTISTTIDHNPGTTARQVSYERIYSLSLYPMQTMSKHGVIFPKVTSFHSNDYPTPIMWVTAVLLTRVEKL